MSIRKVLTGAVSVVIFGARPFRLRPKRLICISAAMPPGQAFSANIHDRNFFADHLITGANGTKARHRSPSDG